MQGVCAGVWPELVGSQRHPAHQGGSSCSSALVSGGFPSPEDKSPILASAENWILHPESIPATPGHQVNPLSLNFPIGIVGAITGTASLGGISEEMQARGFSIQ